MNTKNNSLAADPNEHDGLPAGGSGDGIFNPTFRRHYEYLLAEILFLAEQTQRAHIQIQGATRYQRWERATQKTWEVSGLATAHAILHESRRHWEESIFLDLNGSHAAPMLAVGMLSHGSVTIRDMDTQEVTQTRLGPTGALRWEGPLAFYVETDEGTSEVLPYVQSRICYSRPKPVARVVD